MLHRFASLLLCFLLAGCANFAPVPGGTDDVNNKHFKDKEEFIAKVEALQPGMMRQPIFDYWGVKESELQRLNREDLMKAMIGTNNIIIQDGIQNYQMRSVLQYLHGYRLNYRFVEREHGFTNPIRWRTDETGHNYAVTLIFYGEQLAEEPVISGGEVNNINSKTIFDFLSLGAAVSVASP